MENWRRLSGKLFKLEDAASPIGEIICPLCNDLMQRPIQTVEGDRACAECYISALKTSNGLCPISHEPISDNDIFPDKFLEREMLKLKCHCINKDKGCQWSGIIKEFKSHECDFELVECPMMCGEKVAKKELYNHQTKNCQMRNTHRCVYHELGCSFKANSFEEIEDHMTKYDEVHKILALKKENTNLKDENGSFKKENQNLKQALERVGAIARFNVSQDAQEKQEDAIGIQSATSGTFPADNTEMNETAKISDFDLRQQLHENSIHNGHLTLKNDKVANFQSRPGAPVENTDINKTVKMSDIDLKQQLHENTIYDGHLIWKIDNFKSRRSEAISGKITALHSAPCFTGKYGYKFCLRLYLNGDGMGLNTHLSLFLVIMKSEYDNILEWPFTKKVKFTLINQQNRNNDIVERMVPNKDSSSFQKPRKEMNIASGIPLFVEIDRLEREGFLKGDSLFIDVQIT